MSQHSHDERVRLRAYEIWLNEGRPEGRDARHWEMAREIVGYEDARRSTLIPGNGGAGEPAEPSIAFENQSEMPSLTDQGDTLNGPSRDLEPGTDQPPLAGPAMARARASKGAGTGSRK